MRNYDGDNQRNNIFKETKMINYQPTFLYLAKNNFKI